jgi:TonB family protein
MIPISISESPRMIGKQVIKIKMLMAGSALTLAVAGCTTNTVVMVVPQANRPMMTCWIPDDAAKHYLIPHDTARVDAVAPEAARQKHVAGCAAVTFQLNREGKATNVSVLREFPPGYGYGEAVSEAIRKSRFAPPASKDDLYYRATAINFVNATPAGPVRVMPPQPAPAAAQRT